MIGNVFSGKLMLSRVPMTIMLAVSLIYFSFTEYDDISHSVWFNFRRLGESAVQGIIAETCEMIWRNMKHYVKTPNSNHGWKGVEEQ